MAKRKAKKRAVRRRKVRRPVKRKVRQVKRKPAGKKRTKPSVRKRIARPKPKVVKKPVAKPKASKPLGKPPSAIKPLERKPIVELKGFLSFLILHELNVQKASGEDLAKRIGNRKGAMLTPGTIYPALKNLRQKGLIKFTQFGRKKVYELLPEGRKEAQYFYALFSRYFAGLKPKIKS